MKVTGFTRFLIVMVVVAPLAYLAASYYNGEDGVKNLKEVFGKGGGEKTEAPAAGTESGSPTGASAKSLEEDNQKLREELDYKSKRVDELYRENEDLKRKLQSLEETLEASKKQ